MDYQLENRRLQDELLEIEKRIIYLKKEIQKLQLEKNVKKESKTIITSEENEEKIEEVLNYFEEEVNYYINNYKSLTDNFNKEELFMILPSRKHPKYRDILLRLAVQSFKEIKEAENLMDIYTTSDERQICNDIIDNEKRKINYLREELTRKDEIGDNLIKNEIILVPTTNNKIRILEELEHIPVDYYPKFLELVNSIVDGTFKNVRFLSNNCKIEGISEVKGFKVRIIFKRIGLNSYALISAFIKKTDYDKYYLESLDNKISDYRLMENKLKNSLLKEDFLEYNRENVNALYDILSKSNNLGETL